MEDNKKVALYFRKSTKLESEDTIVEIELNKTKINKSQTNIEKRNCTTRKDSTVVNASPTKMTTEDPISNLLTDSPFKRRPLILRSPPDTPKASTKSQMNTPKLPLDSPSKLAALKTHKQRVDTPGMQVVTPKKQLDIGNVSPGVPQTEITNKTLEKPINLSPLQETKTNTPTLPLAAPTMSPSLANDTSPNTLGMSPSTPPPRAINMPLEEGSSIPPQAEAAAPPRPGTPMPISSPDVLKYNPYEDWQQRLNINQMRQQSRTAKVAAAAGAAAAHVRRGALDVIIDRKQQQTPRSQAAVNGDRHLDEQRGIRNINLLSSALHIIREMDPDYVEKLCYAIHDHMSREKPLD